MFWWYLLFLFSFFILYIQMWTHTKWYFPNFARKMFQNEAKNKLICENAVTYRVLSILPNQPVRNQWNYQEKMERHFSVEKKFSIESSDPFTFRTKLWLPLRKVGLKTRIFGNGTGSFGRTGPTGQRGPPLEVDHFDRKISTWAEPLHLRLDRNFRKFWHNGKHI